MEVSYSEVDEFNNKKPTMTNVDKFSCEDTNNKESFVLKEKINKCRTLRLLMRKFYDLYGRVIVYDIKIKGRKV